MLNKIENKVVQAESFITVVLFLTMVGVVCWSVLCRKVLNIPFISGEEIARYLTIYSAYIGIAIGVNKRAHIGVEVVVHLIKGKAQKFVKILGLVVTSMLFVLLFVLSVKMSIQYINNGQITTMTNLPMVVVYSCIPISMFLSIIHSISNVVKSLHGENVLSEEEEELERYRCDIDKGEKEEE